jgi:hypothetical protein
VSIGVEAELWRPYARAAGLGHSPEIEAQVAYELGLGAVRSPAEITPNDGIVVAEHRPRRGSGSVSARSSTCSTGATR